MIGEHIQPDIYHKNSTDSHFRIALQLSFINTSKSQCISELTLHPFRIDQKRKVFYSFNEDLLIEESAQMFCKKADVCCLIDRN